MPSFHLKCFRCRLRCLTGQFSGAFVFSPSVVGILGAGLMGAGIGQVTMDKGMKTILKDMNDAGVARGLSQIQTGIDAKVKRKKISRVEGERFMSGVVGTTNYDLLSKCDIVIEAVFEDLALKHRVVKEVGIQTS